MNLHSPIIFYNKLWKVKLKWQWQAKLLTKEVFWVNDSYCQALKCVSDSEQIDFDGWYWFSKKSMDILAMSAKAAPMNLLHLNCHLAYYVRNEYWSSLFLTLLVPALPWPARCACWRGLIIILSQYFSNQFCSLPQQCSAVCSTVPGPGRVTCLVYSVSAWLSTSEHATLCEDVNRQSTKIIPAQG